MAVQANPHTPEANIAAAAVIARRETKRLARQLRSTVRAIAELEAACEAHGIQLEVQPDHRDH